MAVLWGTAGVGQEAGSEKAWISMDYVGDSSLEALTPWEAMAKLAMMLRS